MTAAARPLAAALAVSRVAYGAQLLLAPRAAEPSWFGRRHTTAPARVLARGLGVRDLGLGVGALHALGRREDGEAARWMAAHLAADLNDLLATRAERGRLGRGPARFAMSVAAGSTAVAALATAALSRRAAPGTAAPGR